MQKLCASIAFITAVLFGSGGLAEQLKIGDNLKHSKVIMRASVPDRSRMTAVDYIMVVEDGVAVILVFYDDKATARDLDYIEVYDVEGNLLLLSWIDQKGACQVAIDRDLLDYEEPEVDGTLVMIGVGQEL